jgi:hypothetical protein
MATNRSEFALHLENKGEKVVVLPGDDLPGWAKVTNPYVLGDQVVEPDEDGDSDGPPPQAGPGSGLPKWVAYAEGHGVDVDGLSKADAIAALEDAGVRVE